MPTVFSFPQQKEVGTLAKDRQARYDERSRRILFSATETPSTSGLQAHVGNDVEVSSINNNTTANSQGLLMNPNYERSTQVNFEHTYGCIQRFLYDDRDIVLHWI